MWVLLPQLEDDDVDVVMRIVHFKAFHHVKLPRVLLSLRLKYHILHPLQSEKCVLELGLSLNNCSPLHHPSISHSRNRSSLRYPIYRTISTNPRSDNRLCTLPLVVRPCSLLCVLPFLLVANEDIIRAKHDWNVWYVR